MAFKKQQQKTKKVKFCLKRGDQVVVLSGRDKGKTGTITKIINNGDQSRVVVGGVNMVYKTSKSNPQEGITGGINQVEASLHISNVAIYNKQSKNKLGADKVTYVLDDGKKSRVYKSNKQEIS